jgi:hypothetical protein
MTVTEPVNLSALDAKTRRLAERGAKEAFGVSLDQLLSDLSIAGATFEKDDLDTLVLAGEAAERADAVERATDAHGAATEQVDDGESRSGEN